MAEGVKGVGGRGVGRKWWEVALDLTVMVIYLPGRSPTNKPCQLSTMCEQVAIGSKQEDNADEALQHVCVCDFKLAST